MSDDSNFTFFTKLDEDLEAQEDRNQASSGVLSGLFGRWWTKTDSPTNTNPVDENPNREKIQYEKVYFEAAPDSRSDQLASSSSANQGTSNDQAAKVSLDYTTQAVATRKSSKLTTFFKRDQSGLADYNDSAYRQYWMPDSTGKECYQCQEKFNAFRRRHHCRLCGQIFCSKCCNTNMEGELFGCIGELRLCSYCAKKVDDNLNEDVLRQQNEAFDSVPQPILVGPSSRVTMPPLPISQINAITTAAIATVSGGALKWSVKSPSVKKRKKSFGTPPPKAYPSPELLSVEALCAKRAADEQFFSFHDHPSLDMSEIEIITEPEWLRDIAHSEVSHEIMQTKHRESSTVDNVINDFDIGLLSFNNVEIEINQSKANQESLSKKCSTSPASTEFFNENDVNKLFEHRAEMLLEYLFKRNGIEKEKWFSTVFHTANIIVDKVCVNVFERKDNMNILNYIHVKKMCTSEEERKAEIVWGVACTKSVVHTSMCGELPNASIMLVSGSIEYERVTGKLSSIEPFLNQEDDYLKKQVERILSKRPTILLVESYVAKKAADLLREAGVRLATEVKMDVLLRISRATGAEIVPGNDTQLMQEYEAVGFCAQFETREYCLRNAENKHLMVFDQCEQELGCSVLFYGPSLDELVIVKAILQFLVLNMYSAKLEKAFLAQHDVKLTYTCSNCEACEPKRENIEAQDIGNGFLDMLRESVLSISPFIEFEPPFLETPKGEASAIIQHFKRPLYHFSKGGVLKKALPLRSERAIMPDLPRTTLAIGTKASHVYGSERHYRALAGWLYKSRNEVKLRFQKKYDAAFLQVQNDASCITQMDNVMDPFIHKKVSILFGSYSPKSPNAPLLCVRPWVVNMEFYSANDMTLGEFLTKYCFNKEYQCPSTNCELSMMEHSRKMVFGRVCVELTTTQLQHGSIAGLDGQALEEKKISSYHYCEICKASSPIAYMDLMTWHLSFGRFLDYLANASYSIGSIKTQSGQACPHCFFHQLSHFFAFNNFVTIFKVKAIKPHHVLFSPIECTIQNTNIPTKLLSDTINRTIALSESTSAQANERLNALTENENGMLVAGQFHNTLKQLVKDSHARILELANPSLALCSALDETVLSSSNVAIEVNETLMHMRVELYNLISMWNEHCNVLTASIRAMKKDETPDTIVPEVTIARLDNPFPSFLHLSLPLQKNVGVIVRDIQDGSGAYKPDIGSILGYALSTSDYEIERNKSRQAMENDGIPLNLNAPAEQNEEKNERSEHIDIEFQDTNTSYYVKIFYAERFCLLRKLLFSSGENAFIRSLATSNFWTPQGGKSGAFFYRTQDQRFVIKQMSKFEVQSFLNFAPHYFEYLKTAATEKRLTTLCKVYGVFRVGYHNKTTGVRIKTDVLVMEYLFYKRNVSKVWDLKGSLRNRLANVVKSSSDLVLMDENLMKDLWNNQLYIYPHSKAALNQAISNDSHFLSAQHVMDYSLLVGVDEANGELLLGIVDYMRTYTLDKKFESWVKIVAVPGGHLPTVISPQMYCTRFSEAIDTYFPVVPDQWTGMSSNITF